MRYCVKALGRGTLLQVLHLHAADAAQAERIARERGLSVVSVQAESRLAGWPRRATGGLSVGLLAQQLMALLGAGLGTVEALEAIVAETGGEQGGPLRAVLEQVRAGHSLSQALEHRPLDFPPLFIATVRASERTGDLKEALGRFVEYHGQMQRLRGKVVSACIYPALLMLTGALVAAFLLLFVVPRFSRIYEDIGGELPFMSRLLMQWGQFLAAHALEMLVGLLALALGLAWLVSRPAARRALWLKLWRVPQLGGMLRIYHLSRFYRPLGMLLRSGMPLLPSLDLASDLLDAVLRPGLLGVHSAVNEGTALSVAMHQQGLTTPMALGMLRVGEKTGELGAMMDRVAALYDDELSRWVDLATRLFEPLLMAVIGIVIGLIVVLLYLPVFELANQLQ
jgi:general secretion pathway protein F